MKNILSPLQDKIQLFEKKVEDTHKESIDYHAALRQQILDLMLQLRTLYKLQKRVLVLQGLRKLSLKREWLQDL